MKCQLSELHTHVTAALLEIKRGIYDARVNGDIVAELPEAIKFQVEVVTGLNGITRTQTSIDPSSTESQTTSPATTQTTRSDTGGGDVIDTTKDYEEF
jgi:hypothetical protein